MLFRSLGALCLSVCLSSAVCAANYPNQPIRIISPFPAGGGTDFIARLLSKNLSENQGWNVIVDNKPGANGTLGLAEVARAAPNGYELVVGQKDNLVIAPWIMKVSYDPTRNFTPVGLMASTVMVFVVAADSPYDTFDDLVEDARKNPGKVTFGSNGIGSIVHLVADQLQRLGGFKMEHVPYKGTNPALTELVGGHITVVAGSLASCAALLQAGKIKALAVTTGKRVASLPDVPTLAESGFQDYHEVGEWGLLGPAGMPVEVVRTLNEAMTKVMNMPEVIQALAAQGVDVAPSTAQAYSDLLVKEYAAWETVVAQAGIKSN